MVGKRIKQRREQLGISQQELADMLGYKSKAAISKIETDVNSVSRSKVAGFAKALRCSEAYLLGMMDDPEVPVTIKNYDMSSMREHQIRQLFDMICVNQVNDYEYVLIELYRESTPKVREMVEYLLRMGEKQETPNREGDSESPAD